MFSPCPCPCQEPAFHLDSARFRSASGDTGTGAACTSRFAAPRRVSSLSLLYDSVTCEPEISSYFTNPPTSSSPTQTSN